jgi:acetyl esterase/lipase
MHRSVCMAMACAFVGVLGSLTACVSHQGRPATPSIEFTPAKFIVLRNVVYTPADWPKPLTADIYRPEGAGPFPAVVVIHGGGWKTRTGADMSRIAKGIARRGYVAMNITYRLAPEYRFPAQLQDVQQAVVWLRANAQAQNVRADRIGAWGYSAGGHLAALLGVIGPGDRYFVENSQVCLVVAGGAPADLRYYEHGRLTNGLMGVPLAQAPELWRNASPVALVDKSDPPFFLYHATLDFTVGFHNSVKMHNALVAANVPTEFYQVRGLEHFSLFYLWPTTRGMQFLDRYLR